MIFKTLLGKQKNIFMMLTQTYLKGHFDYKQLVINNIF